MPPARIGNYLNCKVIRDNTDLSKLPSTHNYIIIKKLDTENPNFYFVFNKFKTSKNLGTQMFKVENIKLNSLLKLYFKNVNKDGEFFLMSKKKEITQNSNIQSIILLIFCGLSKC